MIESLSNAARAEQTPTRFARRRTVLAVATLATVLTAPTARMARATTLLSPDVGGAAAGGVVLNRNPGSNQDVSPDGRFIVFTSTATDLVAGVTDTNGVADVFLRDVQAGTTAILSVDTGGNALGTVGTSFLGGFTFSPDSTRLIFRTQATGIVAGLADPNNSPDWFVRDLLSGTTSCLTVNAAGTSTGNLTSFTAEPPVFSPDGSLLAFISIAGDLVEGVTDPGGRDLFLRDLDAETTSLVSVATDGTAAGSTTDDPPQFSPDGRYLAFLSLAPDLVAGVSDTNNFTDLFVRDLQTDTTLLVTRTVDDTAALFSSTYRWAPDGHAILFASNGTNLVAGVTDTNFLDDLFLWNTATHEITLVSGSPDGTATGTKVSRSFGFSPNSRFVAFGSASTNLTAESAGGDVKDDLYVRNLQTETTTYVARNASSSTVFGLARFSGDQRHLLFASDANDVVPGIADTNGRTDLFLYDLVDDDIVVVTINAQGTATASTPSTSADDVVLSPSGRYVSFVSAATDLVPNFISTSTRDLFVRDLVAGVTSLVTIYINGGGAGYDQGATRDAEFSPDSRFLVFTTNTFLATPVTTLFNFNFATNLYAFDLVDRALHLLTTNAAGTAPANSGGPTESGVEPFSFIVNPAGESAFFLSTATDMVAGVTDTSATLDLFLAPLPEPPAECGDPIPDGSLGTNGLERPRLIRASDALYMLRVAVGSGTCELCVCDVDGSGAVSATDALVALKIAVGQPFTLQCPAC